MKNPIARIWNALTAEPTPAVAPATPATAPQPVRVAPGEQIDAFKKKYASPPYLSGAHWRLGRLWVSPAPRISEKIARRIWDAAQPIFDDSDMAELRTLYAEQTRLTAKLSELNLLAATRLWQEEQSANLPKLLAGELLHVRGKLAVRDGVVAAREAVHAAFLPLSEKILPVMERGCARLEAAARRLTEAQDAKERAAHADNFGVDSEFVPSALLKVVCYTALTCNSPISNFRLTKRVHCPNPDVDLIKTWFAWPTAAAAPVDTHADARKAQAERDAARRAKEEQTAAESHQEQIAKKATLIETIKAKAAEQLAGAQAAEAQKEADRQARIEAAKARKP